MNLILNTTNIDNITLSIFVLFVIFGCERSIQDINIFGKEFYIKDGYHVENAVKDGLVEYPMFATMDNDGRLFVFESAGDVYKESVEAIDNPQFRILLLEDKDGDGIYDSRTIFADEVGFPQGGIFYEGSLYASSAPDLLKFTDVDGDGIADNREVLLTGWNLNVNANSLVGPFLGPDGWLYLTSAIMGFDINDKEGNHVKGETSRIWRVRSDGSSLEWISAGGMNNPVEVAFTKSGEPIGTETYFTNPRAGLRDALVYWIKGGVYPKSNSNIDRDELVLTGNLMPVVSKYSRVSPAGICRYDNQSSELYDNFFSAHFNTHQIMRHEIERDGGNFKSSDEVFFHVDDEDFHPTDVLVDGNGDLLVIVTGGWFIKGCPLSQVSKPNLKGGIYKIKQKNKKVLNDPYGNNINWRNKEIHELITYLDDERNFVKNKAFLELDKIDLEIKDQLLINKFRNSTSTELRCKIIFSLYRGGSDNGFKFIEQILNKEIDSEIKVAASRCLGLEGDDKYIDKLIYVLSSDEDISVKRQAATALGQIGNPSSVQALLNCKTNGDRFLEHAIIYSLVSIGEICLLEESLNSVSDDIRRLSLISLDQIKDYNLKSSYVLPFLEDDNEILRDLGIWIASHHPEWVNDMIPFMDLKLNNLSDSSDVNILDMNFFSTYLDNTEMQEYLAHKIISIDKDDIKLFLLNVIDNYKYKEFPNVWSDLFSSILNHENSNTEIIYKILDIIKTRGLNGLYSNVTKYLNNNVSPTDKMLMVEALSTLLSLDATLDDKHFRYLSNLLLDDDVIVRKKVAFILGNTNLSNSQKFTLATEYIPNIDDFIIPDLISIFKESKNEIIGETLAEKLIKISSLDNYSESEILEIFEYYQSNNIITLRDSILSLMKDRKSERLAYLSKLEYNIPGGNILEGRKLFFGKALCSTCHTIGNDGIKFGPDLTSIQKDRSAHDILEAIVYPSVSFVREFESYRIVTKDNSYHGIIQQESPDAIVLGSAPQASFLISKDDILSIEISDVSMMPQGLDQLLTEDELADLMVFILGQDQDPRKDEKILR